MIEKNLETLKELHPEYSFLVKKALNENLPPIHKYIIFRIALLEKYIENSICNRPKT